MKIQLERTMAPCPPSLACAVCRQSFQVKRIRTLLFSHQGLLWGDVCPTCLKSKSDGIRQQLKLQARQLLEHDHDDLTAYKDALSKLAAAAEPIQFPTFYQWWLRRLEIFSEASQEIEKARFGRSPCSCQQRDRLQILFDQESR
jgi:hypothetical protein